jgi:glucokinase
MILAGDIGGTNTRLAIFDPSLAMVHGPVIYRNRDQSSFLEIVRAFLTGLPPDQQPDRAAFGVAGPVKAGRASMTNLPWALDERLLRKELALDRLEVINDLLAHAEGIELLKGDQLITIHPGHAAEGNRAIIAAGTGLGEAGLIWEPPAGHYRAFPSEGGHCDFAPRGDQQIALMKWLREIYPSACWERVLSGPGLRNIYDFLISSSQMGPAAALPSADPSPTEISQAGLHRTNPACAEALDLFIACYGAESANLALKMLATGGIYIGGGIAPHIAARLMSDTFVDAFLATGPDNIRALLREIPIHLINFELNGLHGAANHARRL